MRNPNNKIITRKERALTRGSVKIVLKISALTQRATTWDPLGSKRKELLCSPGPEKTSRRESLSRNPDNIGAKLLLWTLVPVKIILTTTPNLKSF